MTFACALALALGLAACGGGDADLLPGKTAEQINANLDQVRAFVDEGDCAGAENAVDEVSEEVDGLGGIDQKLKAALRQGTDRLNEVVSSCGEKALAEEEAERESEEDEIAEQEEQAAVEAEEEELAEEEQKDGKAEEKAEKEAEKEQQAAEKEAEKEETETPEDEGTGQGDGKGPPVETPSGNEPPAGGVGPGTEVE
jgi:septal ring-binding cell division protein DamX